MLEYNCSNVYMFSGVSKMAVSLTLATFSPHLETEFRAALGPDQFVDLKLTEATDLGSSPIHERFSLFFQGPFDRFLAQGLYTMTHAEVGTFDLFLAPIQKGSNGFLYQAIFNRLLHQ